MFRGWGIKPGRYEKKTVGIDVDVVMVLLQGAACIGILFVDLCLLGSWLVILPPEIDWWLGVVAFVIGLPVVVTAGLWWLKKWWGDLVVNVVEMLLFPVRWLFAGALILAMCGSYLFVEVVLKRPLPDGWSSVAERFIDRSETWPQWLVKHWADVALKSGGLTFFVCLLLVVLDVMCCWNWWWTYCLSTSDLTVPVPHFQGGSGWLGLGVFIVLVGTTGILLKPNRYVFGLTSFGGLVVTLAQWARPLTVTVSYERPLLLYGLWAAFCLSFVVGSATVFVRFWWKEIPDPYEPERAAMEALSSPGGDRSSVEAVDE